MVGRLVAEEGDLKGLSFDLEGRDSWLIGRDPDECQIVVEDPLVSRRHLAAHQTESGVVIENLSHTNPALVNDEPLEGSYTLQQGDTVKIGNEVFRFYATPESHIVEDINGQPEPSFAADPISDEEDRDERYDTIFDENHNDTKAPLAHINFGIEELGRWLLKVIGGPNNGAEFYMKASHSYTLGTDPHTCDIVFHDTSVSRQHARITVSNEDILTIEDLKSRNGVLIGGKPVEGRQTLTPSLIVTLGTTSFVVYDREGEMQTIISPLMPSIVKVLQHDEEAHKAEMSESTPAPVPAPALAPETVASSPVNPHPQKKGFSFSNLIFPAILGTILVLGGLGTLTLFKDEPVAPAVQENTQELIQQALTPFPAVKFSYNKATGGLLLVGHVLGASDKNQLLYNLQGLKFIKFIDDSGLIIDEYVWQEINSILSKNPIWKGITVQSPSPGQFVVTGYLQTRKQAEQLADFLSVNFYYLDLLENKVIVEEDVVSQASLYLQEKGLRNVTVQMANGEITLNGAVPADKINDLAQAIEQTKEIPGVRSVRSFVRTNAPEMGIINLTDRYDVTGQSKLGERYTVVINGHILSEGDALDGMTIKSIKPNTILLEKDGNKYRIDYNR